MYDLADEPPPRAAVAQPAARVLTYQNRVAAKEQAYHAARLEPTRVESRKHVWLPIGMIAFGTVVTYLWLVLGGADLSWNAALWHLSAHVALNSVYMLLALFVASRLIDNGFGLASQAVLKVGALAVGPLGLMAVVSWVLGDGDGAVLLGIVLSLVVYWWLFGWFFELDFREAFITLMLVFMIRIIGFAIQLAIL